MKYVIIYKDGERHYHADEQIFVNHLNALAENGVLAEIEKIEIVEE